jgi:hypothetical protein
MSTKRPPKPFIPPAQVARFFWDAAKEHRFVIQRCEACGRYVHWPQLRCPACGSDRLAEAELSGRGTVYSFTVVHHVFNPAFADDVPYNLAIVELDEQPGLRVLTNIVECANDALRIGMKVAVTFEDREGYSLPQFRPAGETA